MQNNKLQKLFEKRKESPTLFFLHFWIWLIGTVFVYVNLLIAICFVPISLFIDKSSIFLADDQVSNIFPSSLIHILMILYIPLSIPYFRAIYLLIKNYYRLPFGVELPRRAARELYETLDEITEELKTPKISRVIISMENFHTYDQKLIDKRLRILPTTVYLGFPVFISMTPNHMMGSLAEICYELRNGKAFLNHAIFFVVNLVDYLIHSLTFGLPIRKNPYLLQLLDQLESYSIVYYREKQFESDRIASKYIGVQRYAEMLVQYGVNTIRLNQDFWPNIYQIAREKETPIDSLYEKMTDFLEEPVDEHRMNAYLYQLKLKTTKPNAYQPEITTRLAALDIEIDDIQIHNNNAGHYFLAQEFRSLINYFGKTWEAFHRSEWKNYYDHIQETQEQIDLYERKIETVEELDYNEKLSYLDLLEQIDKEKALQKYQEYNDANPEQIEVLYAIGRILLSEDKENGIEYLNQALKLNPRYSILCLSHILQYHIRMGHEERVKLTDQKIGYYSTLIQNAEKERRDTDNLDKYIEHDLEYEDIRECQKKLLMHWDVEYVYGAKIDVEYMTERPAYLFGIELKERWYTFKRQKKEDEIMEKIVKDFAANDRIYFIILNDVFKVNGKLRDKLENLPNSCIYNRKELVKFIKTQK